MEPILINESLEASPVIADKLEALGLPTKFNELLNSFPQSVPSGDEDDPEDYAFTMKCQDGNWYVGYYDEDGFNPHPQLWRARSEKLADALGQYLIVYTTYTV